jgi:AraC-like DNA-binding protein
LAEIAVTVEGAVEERRRSGSPGAATRHVLARGDGWMVADVICTCGPEDRRFEELHTWHSVAVVAAGTFQYRSAVGEALLSAGSLMLGNAGQAFECGHEHGTGDRCICFWYEPDHFEQLRAAVGTPARGLPFAMPRVPPIRELSPLVATCCAGLLNPDHVAWDEVAAVVAMHAANLTGPLQAGRETASSTLARVSRAIRHVERSLTTDLTELAELAGLSPFHFLRVFEQITGATPHQFLIRTRLRMAATRLLESDASVLDIALDAGFGDVSNFNRSFRREFGCAPLAFRRRSRR